MVKKMGLEHTFIEMAKYVMEDGYWILIKKINLDDSINNRINSHIIK